MASLDDLFPEDKQYALNIDGADWENVDSKTKASGMGLIDYVRQVHGVNPTITSGYRDAQRNKDAGGAENSWHMQGKAIDLNLDGLSPEQRADVEAHAKRNFGEVLWHDAGSGYHLHAANPTAQPTLMENIASAFKPSVAEASPAPQSNSLDALFADSTPVQQSEAPQSNSLDALFGDKPVSAMPTETTSYSSDYLGLPGSSNMKDAENIVPVRKTDFSLGKIVEAPFSALEAVAHVLDKPRGALTAATYNAMNPNSTESVTDALKRGFNDNTSNVAELNKIRPDSPTMNAITGLGLDIVADPLWLLTPAKVASLIGNAGKMLGADKIMVPLAKAAEGIKDSETMQKFLQHEVSLPGIGRVSIERALSSVSPLDAEKDALRMAQAKAAEETALAGKVLDPLSPAGKELVTKGIEATPANKNVPVDQLYNAVSGTKEITPISPFKREDVIKQAYIDLPKEEADTVSKAIDSLSQFNTDRSSQLLSRNIISQETFDKFSGQYIRREYVKHTDPEAYIKTLREMGEMESADKMQQALDTTTKLFEKRTGNTMRWSDIKQRQDLSEKEQEILGRVMDATHPFAKGGAVSANLINKYDFLKSVMENHSSAEHVNGWRILEGKQYGPLENKWVPKDVFNEVVNSVSGMTDTDTFWRKGVGVWKMMKTIFNPATHVANFASNMILLNIAGMPATSVPIYMAKAIKEYSQKGKLFQEAKAGTTVLLNTFTKNELAFNPATPNLLSKAAEKAGNIYQGGEELGKLAAYMWAKDKGMDIVKAGKFANDALFDYSKVPPVVDWMRRSGAVPFASFPYFATQAVGKALYKDPAVLTKYFKPSNALLNKDETELWPDWVKAHNVVPVGKGERMVNGQPQPVSRYLDMTRMSPVGNDVSMSPIFSIMTVLTTGVDPFTDRPLTKSTNSIDQAQAKAEYIAKALGPAAAANIDKIRHAIKGDMDKQGRAYNLTEAVLNSIGIKIMPINIRESYQQSKIKLEMEIKQNASAIRDVQQDKRLTDDERKVKLQSLIRDRRQIGAQGKLLGESYRKTMESIAK